MPGNVAVLAFGAVLGEGSWTGSLFSTRAYISKIFCPNFWMHALFQNKDSTWVCVRDLT